MFPYYSALKTEPEISGLTLRELQIGLCCLDPSTVHGGLSAQFRCQFIFYFYSSGREHLYFKEFRCVNGGGICRLVLQHPCRQMVKDICTFKKIILPDKELEQSAMENWRCVEWSLSMHDALNQQILSSFFFVVYFVRTKNKAFLSISF